MPEHGIQCGKQVLLYVQKMHTNYIERMKLEPEIVQLIVTAYLKTELVINVVYVTPEDTFTKHELRCHRYMKLLIIINNFYADYFRKE